MTTVANTSSSHTGVRWGRILLAAFLLELALFVILVPIGLVFGMPGADNGTDFRVFFTAVPIGCLVIAYAIGRWLGKGLAAQHALHGLLTGLAAFAIYLAVCSIPPNSIALVVAGYGPPLFWSINVLRLVGCVAGAVSGRRPS